jgi:hypothetical protein
VQAARPEVQFKLADAGRDMIIKSSKSSPAKESAASTRNSLALFAFSDK